MFSTLAEHSVGIPLKRTEPNWTKPNQTELNETESNDYCYISFCYATAGAAALQETKRSHFDSGISAETLYGGCFPPWQTLRTREKKILRQKQTLSIENEQKICCSRRIWKWNNGVFGRFTSSVYLLQTKAKHCVQMTYQIRMACSRAVKRTLFSVPHLVLCTSLMRSQNRIVAFTQYSKVVCIRITLWRIHCHHFPVPIRRQQGRKKINRFVFGAGYLCVFLFVFMRFEVSSKGFLCLCVCVCRPAVARTHKLQWLQIKKKDEVRNVSTPGDGGYNNPTRAHGPIRAWISLYSHIIAASFFLLPSLFMTNK